MSVSKVAAGVETVLLYHHTFSLLWRKILITPTCLLLEYGFLSDPRRDV